MKENGTVVNSCPRCGADSILYKSTGNTIECKKCKLKLECSSLGVAAENWNISKERRVDYTIRNIKAFGDTYVGPFTLEVWKNDDLLKYLREKTGEKVVQRELRYIDDGAVFCVANK